MTITARDLMSAFIERGQRYLWTDAFAVQNFLALDREDLARALVADVHRTLGHDRSGRPLSKEGESRPTLGGLRIGKELPERVATERYDPKLEWDRDGQYFHYLTKWMGALDAFGDATFHRWAVDLAKTAHRGFVHDGRMYWKMSIDLSRPLVPSMGQHDPLDGLVTYLRLHDASLRDEITSFAAIVERSHLETDDPLGLGGLYTDVARLSRLGGHDELRARILEAAESGLRAYHLAYHEPRGPAETRLAFRELGLAIGLQQAKMHAALAEQIIEFWLDEEHRHADSWLAHRNINDVMLATALLTRA